MLLLPPAGVITPHNLSRFTGGPRDSSLPYIYEWCSYDPPECLQSSLVSGNLQSSSSHSIEMTSSPPPQCSVRMEGDRQIDASSFLHRTSWTSSSMLFSFNLPSSSTLPFFPSLVCWHTSALWQITYDVFWVNLHDTTNPIPPFSSRKKINISHAFPPYTHIYVHTHKIIKS